MSDLIDLLARTEAAAKARGLDFDALLAQLGLHRATWNRWKAGTTEPRLKHYRALQAFLAETQRCDSPAPAPEAA